MLLFLAFGEAAAAIESFRYTGQGIDPETGGLYYYRARMHSPALGRFLQADPIGTAGGTNLYAYASNDPLNLVHPYGLTPDIQPGINSAGNLITASSQTDLDQLIHPVDCGCTVPAIKGRSLRYSLRSKTLLGLCPEQRRGYWPQKQQRPSLARHSTTHQQELR